MDTCYARSAIYGNGFNICTNFPYTNCSLSAKKSGGPSIGLRSLIFTLIAPKF